MIEQKTFDVLGEGMGVRVFENGKGFRKSIFFQEEVKWLIQCFRVFRSNKGEGPWGWSRSSRWRTLWMALSSNSQGQFLVFSEGKEGPRERMNRLFLLEGLRADGQWQIMEAIHDVFGVKLVPSEWVTKKERDMAQSVTQLSSASSIVRCPGCSLELGVRLEPVQLSSFPEALRMPVPNWVGQMSKVGLRN